MTRWVSSGPGPEAAQNLELTHNGITFQDDEINQQSQMVEKLKQQVAEQDEVSVP